MGWAGLPLVVELESPPTFPFPTLQGWHELGALTRWNESSNLCPTWGLLILFFGRKGRLEGFLAVVWGLVLRVADSPDSPHR